MEQGSRLRSMYRSLGWSRADCAKFLHVTERCLHNWERGRHAIPFAAFKLIRLHLGYELPGRDWDGWSISRGRLCTPEGHELNPLDAKWWHLLHRRAETGTQALRELSRIRPLASAGAVCTPLGGRAAAVAGAPEGAPLVGKEPVRREAPLDLSLRHFRTTRNDFETGSGSAAINVAPFAGQWTLTKTGVSDGAR